MVKKHSLIKLNFVDIKKKKFFYATAKKVPFDIGASNANDK